MPAPRRSTARAGSWSDGRSVSRAAIRTTRSPRARYRAAFERLGLHDEVYVYEPVGAAFFFAQRLRQDAVVLVADFGGGTSDFSIVRFANVAGRMSPRPLGHAGIGIAGDAFDYRIIDEVVSPQLGKGGEYRILRQDPADAEELFRQLRPLEPARDDEDVG